MGKIRFFLSALTVLLSVSFVQAQNITVSGTVTDSSNGEPVPFASIVLHGTMTGGNTDANGYFSMSVPADGTLIFSSVGYLMAEMPVNGRTHLDVSLQPDSQMLEETIVIAYGTTTRASFTGSASVIEEETLANRQVSNVTNALSGTVAGVQTLSSNGQPGTSSTVRIRGIGSMYASNAPLYIVDGVPYEGDISAINTSDIESMTVLKDAAASALYGARGANGVILINTKKGSGDTQVTLDARWGVNSRMIKNYDVLSSPVEYMENVYTAYYNSLYSQYGAYESMVRANSAVTRGLGYTIFTVPEGQYLFGSNGRLNPYATLGYSDGTYYYTPDNWADEMFSNKLRQEYNLSVSGGNEKIRYFLSAGYLNDQGVITNSGFERITTRLNVDYQAKKWLQFGTNIGYTNSTSRYPGEQTTTNSSGNAFFLANMIAPVYPMYVRDAEGNIMYDSNTGYKLYDYGDGSSTNSTRNWMSISNPMGDLLYNTQQYLMDIFTGKWFAKVTFFKGLTFTGTLGLHIDNTRYHDVGNKYYGQSASYGGTVQQYSERSAVLDQQYILNYRNTFGKHTVDAMVGFESMQYNVESHYVYGYNMYSDDNWTVSNVIDNINGSGSYHEYATMGIISRLSYDYNNRYYVSASFRRDASSRFHPDNRWGNFWSVSAAWDMSNENFLSGASWLDMLKVKASFGQQGNDDLGNFYPYMDQYTVSGSDGVFADGTLSYKGNKDITWEKSNSLNAGVDFSMFNSKLSGTIEYFSRQTSDMLYYRPVAPSNGYTSYPMNIGSMRNSGVEIELYYTPIQTRNVTWTLNWNGTSVKNKILELHPELEGEMISGSYVYREGESMYQFYLVDYAGVDTETGEALYMAKDSDGNEYATAAWDDAYDTNRKGTGDILPKLYGGFGTTLQFYGVDFSVQFAYQLGGRMYDSGYQTLMHGGATSDIGQNWHKDIRNAWKAPGDVTDVPRLNNTDQYTNSASNRWLTSSNYLSINNVTLGYTFPTKWTEKIKIHSLRVYATGDNLALFSARKGLDPRMSYTSGTTATYTAIRSISGGVKITF